MFYIWKTLVLFCLKRLVKGMAISRSMGTIYNTTVATFFTLILLCSALILAAYSHTHNYYSEDYLYKGPITERIPSIITRVGEDTVFFTPDTASFPGQSYRVYMSLGNYSAAAGDFDFLRAGDKVIIAKNTKGNILCIEDVPSNTIFTAPNSECNW